MSCFVEFTWYKDGYRKEFKVTERITDALDQLQDVSKNIKNRYEFHMESDGSLVIIDPNRAALTMIRGSNE